MKHLKGHKPACKCVGCSAATRARGMKALGLSKTAPRSHSKRRRMIRAAIGKLAKMKSFPNPGADRPINEGDIRAAQRGIGMISMSADDLRELIALHSKADNAHRFASRVIVAAARQMLAVKKRVGLHNPRRTQSPNMIDARELYLFADNDGDLYRQMKVPIERMLAKKIGQGKFDKALAVKGWMHFADAAAKKYSQVVGGVSKNIFSVATRKAVAAMFARDFMDKYRRKEYAETTMALGKGRLLNPLNRAESAKLARLARADRAQARKRKPGSAISEWYNGRADGQSEALHRFGHAAQAKRIGAKIRHRNPLALDGNKFRPYCNNCGQWQYPTKAGYLDCTHECARRGFEYKRTLRELKKRELGNPGRKLRNMKRRIARKVVKQLGKAVSSGSFKSRYRRGTAHAALRARRHSNPSANLIGTSPTVHAVRTYYFPKARLMTGQNQYQVRIIGIRKGTTLPIGYGSTVRAIDYRHDAKAMRAYGRRAPFRHKFSTPAKIVQCGWGTVGTDTGYVIIESSSHIWEKQS